MGRAKGRGAGRQGGEGKGGKVKAAASGKLAAWLFIERLNDRQTSVNCATFFLAIDPISQK